MEVTRTCSRFRRPASCMRARYGSANASCKGATAPTTRWRRRPPLESRTSSKAAGLPARPRKPIKLTNVARASLEELLEDYRDFIRLRGIEEWPKDHSHTRRLRLDHFYWQASHSAPLRMASIEQASCSSAVNSRLPPAMPLTSFFTETVDFSMFEAWSVRR
jgi:hypothetical protein